MAETIRTIFIGLFVSVYTVRYTGNFPFDKLELTEYPLSPLKALFFGKKYVNVITTGGDMKDIMYEDFIEFDALKTSANGKKWRIIFMDLTWNKNLALLTKSPALSGITKMAYEYKAERDLYEDKFNNLIEKIKQLEDKDIIQKLSLKDLEYGREAKKKMFSPQDFFKSMKGE